VATIRRPGRDATLVARGPAVERCLAAAESWSARGLDVEVVELGPTPGLDEAAVLASVGRTKNAVLVSGGAELAWRIHDALFAELEHAVQRVGPPGGHADVDSALRYLATT